MGRNKNRPRVLDYVSEWELDEIRHELTAGEEPEFVAFRHGVPRELVTRALAYKEPKQRSKFRRWDPESTKFVCDNYPIHGKDWEGWAKLDRSWKAIQARACLLGFGRSQKDALWKQWEIDFLRENYPDHNKDWEGWQQLDRSWYAIANKAHSMKITMRGRGRPRKVV